MENNCQDCGCKDKFLPVAPCIDPAECPSPSKCDGEVFDTDCVLYTGLDISCGEDVVIPTNANLTTALQNIVDKICSITGGDLTVDITAVNNTLVSDINGGTAPYTYKWSIEQGLFIGHTISGSSTGPVLTLAPILGNTLAVGGISGVTGAVNMSHVKLEVTDANSSKVTKYYTFAKLV